MRSLEIRLSPQNMLNTKKVRAGKNLGLRSNFPLAGTDPSIAHSPALPQPPAMPPTTAVPVACEVVKGRHIWLSLCNICPMSGMIYSERIPCKGQKCT